MEPCFIGYGSDGKPYNIAVKIEENLEAIIRFVASVHEYTLTDVYKMNIVEFFRDFKRAEKIVEKRKQMQEHGR